MTFRDFLEAVKSTWSAASNAAVLVTIMGGAGLSVLVGQVPTLAAMMACFAAYMAGFLIACHEAASNSTDAADPIEKPTGGTEKPRAKSRSLKRAQEEFMTLDPDMKSIVFRLYMVEYLDDRDGSFIRFENALHDEEIARGFDSLISFETLVPDGYRMRLNPEVRKLIDKRPHLLDQAREAKASGSESMPVRAVRIVGDEFQFDKQAYDSWLAKGAAILRARDEPARYLQLASPEELDALMLFIDHDNMVPGHDYDRVSGRLGTLEEAGVIAPLDRGIGDAAYQLDPDFYKCLKASEDSLGMSDGRSKGDFDF